MPIVVEGFEDYIEQLITTDKQLDRICGRSLHPGAKIVSDVCKKKLEALRTDDSWFKRNGGFRHGPTKRQKKFLIESMGIAKMRHTGGSYDVKLGFDGYNDIVSERWPAGQPNAVIARSVNKGTSFMEAQPFMDQSIKESEVAVIKAIEKQFEYELEKIFI